MRREGPANDAEAPARRKRRSAEEIMNKLLAAATAEFGENGYAGATTAAIARRGDVTEAQLFRYFPSKAELFRAAIFKPMIEQVGRFDRDGLDGAPERAADRSRARVYIGELQQFLRQHARVLMPLMVARACDAEAHPSVGTNSLDRYFERAAATLARGLGRDASVSPRVMVRVSFAALFACAMFDDWLFPPEFASREEIDEAIETFIVSGVSSGTTR